MVTVQCLVSNLSVKVEKEKQIEAARLQQEEELKEEARIKETSAIPFRARLSGATNVFQGTYDVSCGSHCWRWRNSRRGR